MMFGIKFSFLMGSMQLVAMKQMDIVNKIQVTASGQRLKTINIIKVLNIIGQKQCIRKCLQNSDCKSVNYRRQQLDCELTTAKYVDSESSLVLDADYDYIEMDNHPTELAGFCNSTLCEGQCTVLSNGKTFCIPNGRCPDNFKSNTTLYFCLAPRTESLTWYQANETCSSKNGRRRLAVLDTQRKVEAALSIIGGQSYTHYWIGATYDAAQTQSSGKSIFYWNSGKQIDSTFQSQYRIEFRSGTCVFLYIYNGNVSFWADPCTAQWAAICEYIL